MSFKIKTSDPFDAEVKRLYDKADASNVKINVIKEIIKGLGL